MSGVQGSGRVGRVGNETVHRRKSVRPELGLQRGSDSPVNGVSHLQTDVVHVVELHGALILSIDLLVTDQTGSSNGGLRHTVTDKEDDVFGTSLGFRSVNGPVGQSLLIVVVIQCQLVLSGFIEGQVSVSLGSNVDDCRGPSIPGEKVLRKGSKLVMLFY